jgi:hypothetical protein
LYSYPLEACLQLLLFTTQRLSGTVTLHFTPVLSQELSYLPYPSLIKHILLTAPTDPALARRVIDACAIAPGQRYVGRIALAQLQAQELEEMARQRRFAQVIELQGQWLPGVEGADARLLALRETARFFAAADKARNPFDKKSHLETASDRLNALENKLRANNSLIFRALLATLPTWKHILHELSQRTKAAVSGLIPNPFRTDALNPEQGREVFRGRQDLVHRIATLLADPGQSASVALLGPRKCGKTSLLRMLPVLLPDAVPIFFDLQANPVDSPAAFFRALEQRARDQARRDRRLDLPCLPEGLPFESGRKWFAMLEEAAGDHRILICIDEFERLEKLYPGNHRELLQLMGLFRATIQHRRKLCLLVSGAAPFDELDTMWDDHFINLRELRVEHLDRPTSLDLLTRPVPEFPPQAIPLRVAESIFERTGGQPFLLQLYGSKLLSRLNDERRHETTAADVAAVEKQVLSGGEAVSYFRNTYQAAPEPARETMVKLAFGQNPGEIERRARRWLRRRCLISDTDDPRIPVLYEWIKEEA